MLGMTTKVINVTITQVIIKLKIFQGKTLMRGKFHGISLALGQMHRNDQISIFEVSYKYTKNSVHIVRYTIRPCYQRIAV